MSAKNSLPVMPVNLDSGEDVLVDSRLPELCHTICTNIAFTAKVDTKFYVHLFSDEAVIFCEGRFLLIASDSRNHVCNQREIASQAVLVLPYCRFLQQRFPAERRSMERCQTSQPDA